MQLPWNSPHCTGHARMQDIAYCVSLSSLRKPSCRRQARAARVVPIAGGQCTRCAESAWRKLSKHCTVACSGSAQSSDEEQPTALMLTLTIVGSATVRHPVGGAGATASLISRADKLSRGSHAFWYRDNKHATVRPMLAAADTSLNSSVPQGVWHCECGSKCNGCICAGQAP